MGARGAKRYWAIFEDLRAELGYADYLGALQRFRIEYPHDLRLLTVSRFLINYPFANRLFPNSLDAYRTWPSVGPDRAADRWRRCFPAAQGGTLRACSRRWRATC